VCQACKDLDPEDKAILEGVAAVERAHLHDVVLYLALPFDVYTLAWIWHGISNEDMLTWKPLDKVQTPYPAAAMQLALRVFHTGQQFPLFKVPDLELCWPVSGRPSVRETGGQRRVGTVTSISEGLHSITVKYDKESKQYVPDDAGCFPLVDAARESQAKALTDEELIKNGVSNTSSLKSYLTKLGIVAQDGQDGTKPDQIPGISERLLALNLNAFGSWQAGPKESSWDQFRMNGISFDSAADLIGGQLPFLKDIFDERQLAANVRELVQKQLQLLVCVVKNRTIEPGTVTGCDSLVADMKTLISCPTAADLTELMSTALPPSVSACKKVVTTVPGAPSTKCGTDVLLQLVMTPDLANDLAYLSSEGGAPDSARDEGESFVRGYNELKNTPTGDNVQVRSLLRRDPFASGSGLQFAAHSSVFRDTKMMFAMAGIASDIRDTVLGHIDACWTTTSTTTSTTTTTTGEVRPRFFQSDVHPLRTAGIMLLAGLSVTALCYYRLQRAAPARGLRAIEMQEHV
ncbi:CHR12, partial [Symbiodinium necroappetens]